MYFGLFEMYKIGIGPSSSHTFGPMVAGYTFAQELIDKKMLEQTTNIEVNLYGSLSLTGKGHLTDRAIILGLSGFLPESVDLNQINTIVDQAYRSKSLKLAGIKDVDFVLNFLHETLSFHENGMQFCATFNDKAQYSKRFYSIGGGFIVTENGNCAKTNLQTDVPHNFSSAKELLEMCGDKSISDIILENEKTLRSYDEIIAHARKIKNTMDEGVLRGLSTQGNLPAPTSLMRRAKDLYDKLNNSLTNTHDIMIQMDWVNVFALAVSEENGDGGRVVTAPTNGACGVIPAVISYYEKFVSKLDDEKLLKFYLVSAAIGALFKKNASIAGAEVGCQGEIGVASSMAAAGLAAIYGASNKQICVAAEIAMEHHLGLTCDPVNGQVQIPCIERNSIAAVTSINATAMALSRAIETTRVSLDNVIETMRQTGKDMDPKYRETSCGGLAKVITTCK